MKYYSTKNPAVKVSEEIAVLKGLPEDNGLFVPEEIPLLDDNFFKNIEKWSFQEISFEVAKKFFDSIDEKELKNIIYDAINFDAPVVNIDNNIFTLELFHGPTLAFKDFGARFMSRVMSYFINKYNKKLVILVATSGDTGSAVANGFYGIDNIDVVILYPSKKISNIQEKQIATLDKNIIALEIDGTFDDCQYLVKTAFLDSHLNTKIMLSSANSINVARLIPQSFYYFYAYSQLQNKDNVYISVPSGNFGNLTAGLFAKRMGLPVKKFVASTNANSVFTEYLNTGEYRPRPSIKTISNAMDVGNPSNFERIKWLYKDNINAVREDIVSYSFSDDETKIAIKEVFGKSGYILDPHGAVGYLGLINFFEEVVQDNKTGIFLETAHPAKFLDIVEPVINSKVDVPKRLGKFLNKEKRALKLSNKFDDLKNYLLNVYG